MRRAFGILLLLAVTTSAQTWKPAPVTLTTEWGARVTPDNAWREYPRPQFVRERWQRTSDSLPGRARLLIRSDGTLDTDALQRLLAQRDNRPISLAE